MKNDTDFFLVCLGCLKIFENVTQIADAYKSHDNREEVAKKIKKNKKLQGFFDPTT